MFEKFTDRSTKVMALANQEAQRFNHEYIGPEHLLLGLVKEGSGVGASALKSFNVDLPRVRIEVEKLVKRDPVMVSMGKLPKTPGAKKAIEFAIEEARTLDHHYIGTEHLLLGLLRDQTPETMAQKILKGFGLKLEEVRAEVMNILGLGDDSADSIEKPITPRPTSEINLGELHTVLIDDFSQLGKTYEQWSLSHPNLQVTGRGVLVFYCEPVK